MPRVTVARIAGGWQVTNEDRRFGTAAEAEIAARRQLEESGGGELVVKGRGGKVLMQDKISRPGSQNLLKGAGLLVPDLRSCRRGQSVRFHRI